MKSIFILGALLFTVALSSALPPAEDVVMERERRQTSIEFPASDREALIELRDSNPALLSSGLLGWDENMKENNTCLWVGIQCNDDGVTTIQLRGRGITTLPESIFQLRRVTIFDFRDNLIEGTLPRTITLGDDRVTFSSIYLSNNSLSGNISSDLMKSNLKNLDLSNNQLSGSLPNNLGDMTKLWVLNISRNLLQGGIPSSFTQLGEMDTLDLSHNQLSGEVPAGMSQMTQLSIINLAGNQFTGDFPDLIALPSLSYLNLAGTTFSGLAPSFLQAYALDADLSGVQFRCPLPDCLEGVSCVLSGAPCTCPCSFSGGGECVLDSLECACYPHRWGENCAFFCPGNSNSSTVACSGRGNCDSATGACICDTGFGGDQCETICPGGPQNPCYGFGTCNQQGVCECDANRDPGSSCSNCAEGYAGPSCEIECLSCNPDHGECDGGLSGSGRCNCFEGYEGVLCEREANTTPIGWLVVGIIMIILFVAAVVLIIAGSYYGWKQYNEYQELKSKDVPMDDMRRRDSSGSESEDSKVGTKREEDITDI